MNRVNDTKSKMYYLLLLFIFNIYSVSVLADDYLKVLNSGSWSGGSIDNTGNGKADFCQLNAGSDAGFTILLIWAEPGLLMAVVDDDLNLSKGQLYPAEISIDPVWSGRSSLKATSSSVLVLKIFKNKKIINALKRGSTLSINVEDAGRWQAPLQGSSRAITKLKSCYHTEVEGRSPYVAKKSPRPKPIKKSIPKPAVELPAAISLMPDKSTFTPDQKISISFSGLPAKGQDWLALSAVSHQSNEYFDTIMLKGKPKSGRHGFIALPEGEYEVRAYTNWPDGAYKIAAKTSVLVAQAHAAPKPPIAPVSLPKSLPNPAAKKVEPVAQSKLEPEPQIISPQTPVQNTGSKKEEIQACLEYKKSALSGNSEGMLGLGLCYLTGEGSPDVAEDVIESLAWLIAARQSGSVDAEDFIKELESVLDEDSLSVAKQKAKKLATANVTKRQ